MCARTLRLFKMGFLAGFSGGIALSLALVTAFPVPLGRYLSWRISPHLSRKIGYGSQLTDASSGVQMPRGACTSNPYPKESNGQRSPLEI
jgi:hypothetical protein